MDADETLREYDESWYRRLEYILRCRQRCLDALSVEGGDERRAFLQGTLDIGDRLLARMQKPDSGDSFDEWLGCCEPII